MGSGQHSLILFKGGNVELPVLGQQRLIERVRSALDDTSLVIDRVEIAVFQAPDGALSCGLDLHVSAHVQLTVRERGPQLEVAVDRACARSVDALARMQARLRTAFELTALELAEHLGATAVPNTDA